MKVVMPKMASSVLATLESTGFEVYVTGGVVHDFLLKRPLFDWDITTNATPEKVLEVFPDAFYNNRFGTVGLADPDIKGCVYDITTYRTEVSYSDRRHPDKVSWGKSLKEDVVRRDFTINAMALKPVKKISSEKKGVVEWDVELIDLVGGQKDLENKLIKAVGNPEERFQEDALRMMRAIRVATQLGFLIEETTFLAIRNNAQLIDGISGERIRDEIFKILSTDFPADGINLLKNSGILSQVLPELEACFGIDQKSPGRHHIYDVGTHLVMSLKNCPSEDPVVRMATLLHDIGKPKTYKKDLKSGMITFYNHELVSTSLVRGIAERLRLSKDQREKMLSLVRWHQFTVDEHQTDSALRRFIRNIGAENIDAMLDLRTGDRLGGGATETSWRTEVFKKRLIQVQQVPFQVKDLKINGNDVMEKLDIPAGKKVGEILNLIFEEVDEEKIPNDRETLLKRIIDIGKAVK